jgi:hypothetical protein
MFIRYLDGNQSTTRIVKVFLQQPVLSNQRDGVVEMIPKEIQYFLVGIDVFKHAKGHEQRTGKGFVLQLLVNEMVHILCYPL